MNVDHNSSSWSGRFQALRIGNLREAAAKPTDASRHTNVEEEKLRAAERITMLKTLLPRLMLREMCISRLMALRSILEHRLWNCFCSVMRL